MASPLSITVYTRHHCHLCEEVEAMLAVLARKYPLKISMIDIDSAPELVEQYGQRVPVVVIQGKERFFGKVQAPLLERVLRAEAGKEL